MKRKTYTTTVAAKVVGYSRRQFIRLAEKEGIFPVEKNGYNVRTYAASDVHKLLRKLNRDSKKRIDNIIKNLCV